jgi:hypothetical protein
MTVRQNRNDIRRDMAVSKGQFGSGYVAIGFIICKEDLSWNDHQFLEQEKVTIEKWAHPTRRLSTAPIVRERQLRYYGDALPHNGVPSQYNASRHATP